MSYRQWAVRRIYRAVLGNRSMLDLPLLVPLPELGHYVEHALDGGVRRKDEHQYQRELEQIIVRSEAERLGNHVTQEIENRQHPQVNDPLCPLHYADFALHAETFRPRAGIANHSGRNEYEENDKIG